MEYKRTETRLQLFNNGFDPLPNKRKMCLLKGWSKLDVTEDLINSREWRRSGQYRDTGVRCGKVIAIDMDILDEKLIENFIEDAIIEGVLEESPFVRIGKPPKEMWIYRTEEKIGKSITGKFGKAGDKDGHQVEVLGYGSQFGAYGQHSDAHDYTWPDKSLVDHHISELPVITKEQVRALIEFAIHFFEGEGLVRITSGGDALDGFNKLYDLEPNHTYATDDMGDMSVDELEEYLKSMPADFTMRLRSSPFRPGETDLKSVLASITHDELCISDFYLGTSQFRSNSEMLNGIKEIADFLKPIIDKKRADILQADADAGEMLDLHIHQGDDWETKVAKCLKRYVYVATESSGKVGDLLMLGRPDWLIGIEAFKNLLYPHYQEHEGPRKALIVERLDHTWRQSPQRTTVKAVAMRPDKEGPLFIDEDGVITANTYKRPIYPVSGGDSFMGRDFIRKLLPDEKERDWFMTWLAAKYQNPGIRGHGIVMVANKEYGTGRGSLLKFMAKLFGENVVESVSFEMFSGKTYQSQYNDYLSDSVIIAVEETQEISPGETSWTVRNNAYEHLKNSIDPGKESMLITRKGTSNTRSKLFSSVLMFTNHADALVIPAKDRRLVVLSNGEPQDEDYWIRFHKWMSNPSNLGAFTRHLEQVDTSGYNPYGAPLETDARTRMIEGSSSDLDRTVEEILDGFVGDIVVFEQVRRHLEHLIETDDLDLPDNWVKVAQNVFKKTTDAVLSNQRIRIAGKRARPRIIRNIKKWGKANVNDLLAEAEKNGDPEKQDQGAKDELGKVIDFSRKSKAERSE